MLLALRKLRASIRAETRRTRYYSFFSRHRAHVVPVFFPLVISTHVFGLRIQK